jgi:hypothetical protein
MELARKSEKEYEAFDKEARCSDKAATDSKAKAEEAKRKYEKRINKSLGERKKRFAIPWSRKIKVGGVIRAR